jgi:hypothetical protein
MVGTQMYGFCREGSVKNYDLGKKNKFFHR